MCNQEICGNCKRSFKEPNGSGTCTYATGPEHFGAVDLSKGPAHNYKASTFPGDAVVWEKYFEVDGSTCFVPKPEVVVE